MTLLQRKLQEHTKDWVLQTSLFRKATSPSQSQSVKKTPTTANPFQSFMKGKPTTKEILAFMKALLGRFKTQVGLRWNHLSVAKRTTTVDQIYQITISRSLRLLWGSIIKMIEPAFH